MLFSTRYDRDALYLIFESTDLDCCTMDILLVSLICELFIQIFFFRNKGIVENFTKEKVLKIIENLRKMYILNLPSS